MPEAADEIDPIALAVLRRLEGNPLGSQIILGGYFALQQYAGYRRTHDIDAWWKDRASPDTEAAIRASMQTAAADEQLRLRERRFGETVSFELHDDRTKRFSFQIAVRSVQLEPPLPSAWRPLLIETIADNIGSKMNALVDRGAPRDFTDIRHVVDVGLFAAAQCWELWSRKNPREDVNVAREKVMLHLTWLETRRPLESILDPAGRERARATRAWFKEQFLSR